MKQFTCLSLALFASLAVAQAYGPPSPLPPPPPSYGGGSGGYGAPAIQQVSLAGLSKLVNIGAVERYLNGPAASYSGQNSGSYAPAKYIAAASGPSRGTVISSSYSEAPASYGGGASSGGYGGGNGGYGGAPVPILCGGNGIPCGHGGGNGGYGGAPVPIISGYGGAARPKYQVLAAHVTQINPGKNNYKAYQTPIRYSSVALPIVPNGSVANLYVPENKGYGSSGSSYGGGSSSY
ncbi:chorion protein S19 [Anastrepha obliqua]|uniref:chorion protein S19 n=1 Tax=Anastrepha obliqua TaxID=95512 RepID=UPI00240A4FE3|nr:chorion protein S19 [Anastrepha obliqua]